MKTVEIPKIELEASAQFEQLKAALQASGADVSVSTVNWKDYPYCPEVKAKVAYTETHLWTEVEVTENHILGKRLNANDDVWCDSCFEIFIEAPDGKHYYNFENNCIGTGLVGYRLSQTDFELLSADGVQSVVRKSSLPHEAVDSKDGGSWQLVVGIPFALMGWNGVPAELRANFYKCGDETSVPHFLSWAPIDTPTPSFHQPKFFGKLVLK